MEFTGRFSDIARTVTIDARWMIGGIGTYIENLLRGFQQHAGGLELHAIVRDQDALRVKPWCSKMTVIDLPIYSMWEQFAVPRVVRNCRLLHVPHYNVPLLHRGPLIVSIMDIIHITCPDYRRGLKSSLYARPMLKCAVQMADHIITVSNYSKAQIMKELGVEDTKITVIHCGVSERFHLASDTGESRLAVEGLGISRPYLLYVGNLKPHKNVVTLLRAFANLHAQNRVAHALVIIGDDVRWKRTIVEECGRLGISDKVLILPQVSQSILPKIYAAAELLVMPSKVEGFGLPVLEAMACGTPVVCSKAASLPEVAGDAAAYFDPASPDDLAGTVAKLIDSSDLRAWLRTKGLERAKLFSWQEFIRKHVELYRRILARS